MLVLKGQTLGDRIREIREHAGYTQQELAEVLGLRAGGVVVSRWERNAAVPSEKHLVRLVRFCRGLTVEELMTGEVAV